MEGTNDSGLAKGSHWNTNWVWFTTTPAVGTKGSTDRVATCTMVSTVSTRKGEVWAQAARGPGPRSLHPRFTKGTNPNRVDAATAECRCWINIRRKGAMVIKVLANLCTLSMAASVAMFSRAMASRDTANPF